MAFPQIDETYTYWKKISVLDNFSLDEIEAVQSNYSNAYVDGKNTLVMMMDSFILNKIKTFQQ